MHISIPDWFRNVLRYDSAILSYLEDARKSQQGKDPCFQEHQVKREQTDHIHLKEARGNNRGINC